MESRPFLSRIPDQSLIVSANGERGEQMRATRDTDGSYAFVYLPRTRPVQIDLTKLRGATIRAWWYSPRTGQLGHIGKIDKGAAVTFTPPGPGPDWVLVLDDAAAAVLPPGVVD
jgi:hypothetical protein